MKDSEFIELLNLYLDHEISAADAARLEAEVQNNPARRKVYQQYCRMQKACKVLATDFAGDLGRAAAGSERKVVAFDAAAAEAARAGRKRAGNFYTVGTFAAAAACVAIVFVGRNRQTTADEAASFAAQPQAQSVAAQPIQPVANVATDLDLRPMLTNASAVASGPRALGAQAGVRNARLVADPLLLSGNAQADALRAAAMEQAKAQLAWIHTVQLAPLQQPAPFTAMDLRFDPAPKSLRPDARSLGNRAPAHAEVEMAAFQFLK